jgi:hypothetical protein
LSFGRDEGAKEIGRDVQKDLSAELKKAWKLFGKHLPPFYRRIFDREIEKKLMADEFDSRDLRF